MTRYTINLRIYLETKQLSLGPITDWYKPKFYIIINETLKGKNSFSILSSIKFVYVNQLTSIIDLLFAIYLFNKAIKPFSKYSFSYLIFQQTTHKEISSSFLLFLQYLPSNNAINIISMT